MTQRLANKRVFITGASSGIGAACAAQFAAAGAHVLLTARRLDRIQALAATLMQQYSIQALAQPLDIRDAKAVERCIKQLPAFWQSIDILVNNAGLALTLDKVQDGRVDNWDAMIDTNLKGLLYVTHAVLPGMMARKSGHIINIGSIAGQECYPGGNVYSATKHAVRGFTRSLRIDLVEHPIRVSEIDPGAVETEFSCVRFSDATKAKAVYENFNPLIAEDVADAVLYCATRRPEVNIAELMILPADQASIGHIHRHSVST